MNHVAQISNLRVERFTDARLRVHRSISIQATGDTIWALLNDHTRGHEWLPAVKFIESIAVSGADHDGVGASHIAVYGSGDRIEERVVYAESNSVWAYQAAFPSMVKEHLAVMQITESSPGECVVDFFAYFTPTEFSGYLMRLGVYSLLVRSSLKKLKSIARPPQ